MSLTIAPVSAPYTLPVVADPQTATDGQHAHDEARRRQQQHHHAETPSAADHAATPPEPESGSTHGTLIDVIA